MSTIIPQSYPLFVGEFEYRCDMKNPGDVETLSTLTDEEIESRAKDASLDRVVGWIYDEECESVGPIGIALGVCAAPNQFFGSTKEEVRDQLRDFTRDLRVQAQEIKKEDA
jgi:hypothetical protein